MTPLGESMIELVARVWVKGTDEQMFRLTVNFLEGASSLGEQRAIMRFLLLVHDRMDKIRENPNETH